MSDNSADIHALRLIAGGKGSDSLPPSDGGGGGSMDDVVKRVNALEKGHELIISKLDGIARGIADGRLENEKRFGAIEGRLTGIEKTLDQKASKSDLTPIQERVGTIDGTVRGLPGVAAMITLVLGTVTLCLGGTAGLAFALAKYLKP